MSVPSATTAHDIKQKPRTGDVLIEENLDFRGLLLSENVQQGLSKSGFERPSPIQLKAIPLGRCGLDLIVQAKSGTGKTCVFAVIALEGIMLESMATQVLVLAPTREIAVQISDVINDIGSCMPGLRCLTFIGGTPLHEDRQKLARCHIAVGTPGRIKQLIEENALSTSNIRLFVLDEADKLLENSFQDQINWIYSALSENKQMLALSATYPEVLAQHLTAYMRNPTFLRLNVTDPALLGIRQYYRTVKFHPLPNKLFDNKTDALIELLSSVDFHQCLVFSNYQMRAQSLSEVLNFRGWPATYISGSREQQERMAAMASLKQMTCRVLISTDLTSRGIDAENVNLVVNLDIPPSHETYLHRIGRAGRFGTYGAGVTFMAEGKEMDELRRLETDCNTEIKPLPDPVPKDLAHSSGYVSLDHLITTETIVTDKGKNQPRLGESAEKVKTGDESRLERKAETLDTEATSVKSNGKVKSYGPRPKGYGPRSIAKPNANAGESPQAIQADNSTPPASELDKSNGSQCSEIGQVKNGEKISSSAGSTNGATASENCPSTEATSSEQDNVETKSPVKPKWKKNNIWTSMSFNYTEEWNELDEKREREEAAARALARSERRPDNARRRRQGPSGPRGTTDRGGSEEKSKSPTPQLPNGASKVVPPIPDRKDFETSKDVVSEVCKAPQSCFTQCASESPSSVRGKNLEIPSLIEIRGESVSPRTFEDISQDYEKYAAGDVPEKENAPPVTLQAKQDSNVERYTQYLEDVRKFLQRDSQKEIDSYNAKKKSFEERNPKISTVVGEESEKQTSVLPKVEKSPSNQHLGTVNTSEAAPQDDDKKILKEKPKDTQTHVKSNLKELVAEKSSCRASSETGVSKTAVLCPPKEETNNVPSAIESYKEGKLQKSNKALFNGKGVKKTGKTAEEMLLSYQAINDNPSYSESDQSIPTGAGKEQSDTEASSAITSGSSSRPSKPRRRVDPYGPWSPYVAPEPLLPESSNITDDEASEEGLSDEGSEWESSDLDCVDGEESEGGPHSGRQSSSKPPKPGHEGCTLPTEYLTAHHNMWMAQQQMQFTTACYQNYMMHLQYAEYYKKLLKNQQRQWKMEDFYLTQKKYIKQMAKWMSQNYQS